MGLAFSTYDEYITWEQFVAFVSRGSLYLELYRSVWTDRQRFTLLGFLNQLITTLETSTRWGAPGSAWPTSSQLRQYFTLVREAVPKSNFFSVTYPYTVSPFNSSTPLPSDAKDLSRLFLVVAFFWGVYRNGYTVQTFLQEVDYEIYAFSDSSGNLNIDAVTSFVSGSDRMLFVGRELRVSPRRIVVFREPGTLMYGRLVDIGQDQCNTQNQEYISTGTPQAIPTGIYLTRSFNSNNCTCCSESGDCVNSPKIVVRPSSEFDEILNRIGLPQKTIPNNCDGYVITNTVYRPVTIAYLLESILQRLSPWS